MRGVLAAIVIVGTWLNISCSQQPARDSLGDSRSETVASPPLIQRESSKDRDEEWERQVNELSRELAPEQRSLKEAVSRGDWQQVLIEAEALESRWAASELVEVHYERERAEALIGLGRPQEARDLLRTVSTAESEKSLTLALALAMTDQLGEEQLRAIIEGCVRPFPEIRASSIPMPTSRDGQVAVVRMARAIEANGTDEYVAREAREALRLDPEQALASYVLAQALNRQGAYEEALIHWRKAEALPGRTGNHARDMAKSTDSVLRNAPPP
jgi:tetratricopeptide (TPR) repeat protein